MYHIGLQTLRAKIRGLQATGSTIRRRISKSEKERRQRLWQLKRELGDHCRHHLIAYAILRGVAYDKVERCAERNRPNPQAVLDIVEAHNSWVHQKYDLAAIEALLGSPARTEGTTPVRARSVAGSPSRDSSTDKTAPTMAQEKAA